VDHRAAFLVALVFLGVLVYFLRVVSCQLSECAHCTPAGVLLLLSSLVCFSRSLRGVAPLRTRPPHFGADRHQAFCPCPPPSSLVYPSNREPVPCFCLPSIAAKVGPPFFPQIFLHSLPPTLVPCPAGPLHFGPCAQRSGSFFS